MEVVGLCLVILGSAFIIADGLSKIAAELFEIRKELRAQTDALEESPIWWRQR